MAKVTLENFESEMQKILKEYEGDIQRNMDAIVDKAGQKAVKLLRSNSPVNEDSKQPKAYAKGWTLEKSSKHTGRLDPVYSEVYNRHPGLPHLLEHGHALRQGGRSPAKEHIAPVEDAVFDSIKWGDL